MEAIFNITPVKGKLPYYEDLYRYLMEKDGVCQTISLRDTAKTSEKMRMYAYLFGPVMFCAVKGLTKAGYDGVDKVKARYILEAMFCKAEVMNSKSGKITQYTESISGMNKKRLLKFINDVLLFLELELGEEVPDAQEWKAKLISGRNFKTVKNE
jgi:hypothetical protein